MNQHLNIQFVLTVSLLFLPISRPISASEMELQHIPPETKSEEIQSLAFDQLNSPLEKTAKKSYSEEFYLLLKMGQTNLELIKNANLNRKTPLTIYSSEVSILSMKSSGSGYSERTINSDFKNLIKRIPAQLSQALQSSETQYSEIKIPENEFLFWSKSLDHLYSLALRWILRKPQLETLRAAKYRDIRGYLWLKEIPNLNQILIQNHFKDLNRNQVLTALLSICQNSAQSKSKCKEELVNAERSDRLIDYKNKYWLISRSIYHSFFKIQKTQSHFKMITPNQGQLYIQSSGSIFLDQFLQKHVSHGWSSSGLSITVHIDPLSQIQVFFESGVIPHVNRISGNQIFLNSDQLFDFKESSWIIQHEFGHLIGFPDCYLEFYDDDSQQIESFQIDTHNIMCSRSGRVTQEMADEIFRIYTPN